MRALPPIAALVILFASCSDDASEPAPASGASVDGGSPSAEGGGPNDGGVIGDGTTLLPDSALPEDAAALGPLYAFVGSSDGMIRVYDVDSVSGAWTLKKATDAGSHPSFIAFDPPRRRLYAVDEGSGSGLVRAFSFDPATGDVVEINNRSANGGGSTHLSLDPTAKWVMVANYGGGNMSILPVEANGALGVATDIKASGPKSHWAGTNPSGTHVFVPSLDDDAVAQYTLDAATGKLTDNGSAGVPNGAGPRHLAFHPTEKWAYTMNELAVTVTTFDFAKATGLLTAKDTVSALPVAQSPSGVSGAEIFVHPSGKWVYGSTRIYNSIAVFTVDAQAGTLTLTQNALTGNDRPRSFGMSPEGALLYAGNQDENEVVGFRIDASTGALTSLGKTVDVEGPSFVGLARIP